MLSHLWIMPEEDNVDREGRPTKRQNHVNSGQLAKCKVP